MPVEDDPNRTVSDSGMLHARCRGGSVYLDIAGDAYFCAVDPELAASIHHPGAPDTDAPGALAAPRWHELPLPEQVPIGRQDVRLFLVALAKASWAYRTRSFADLLAGFERVSAEECRSGDPAALSLILARFERLCPWLPFRFLCLFRSLLLLTFLRLHGLRAQWVFGVALFPFEAHCWIARGDVLLGERAHRVERFTTILTLGEGAA